jgi:streptomycin 6-kinase
MTHDRGAAPLVPARLAAACARTPARQAWLAGVPATIDDVCRRWRIALGPPFDHDDVSCAWVAPATRADGTRAVLKVGMPHMEGRDEIAGLRAWNGNGAVRVLEADDDRAMLLERCEPGASLRTRPVREQDVVIAALLDRLWQTPVPAGTFRPLAALTTSWADETRGQRAAWPDDGLVGAGLHLLEELAHTPSRVVLLATDLHAGNVLSAEREPWLAIDPKPFVGDAAYDATQHLLNGLDRLRTNPLDTVARVADLLRVDRGRVRLWLFARLAADPRDDWAHDPALALARAIAP